MKRSVWFSALVLIVAGLFLWDPGLASAKEWNPQGTLVASWNSGKFYPRGNLSIGGIGVTCAQLYDSERPNHIGQLVVLEVYKDSPALKAGIEKGDIIQSIDGHKTEGEDFAYLIDDLLRGEEGAEVKLTIWRSDQQQELKLGIARGLVVY